MEKKTYRFCNYENERISIKNSLPYLKSVLRLYCVVHGPIYGRFIGLYERKPFTVSLGYLWCHFRFSLNF